MRGPSYNDRRLLIEFVIEELRSREYICKHRIEPVRKYLENHKDNLLEFVPEMEKLLAEVSIEFEVPLADLQGLLIFGDYQLRNVGKSTQYFEID